MIVIPAIDLKGGSCVRLYQGNFDRETRYGDDPAELARRYRAAGFDHLHIVDLDGALTGRQQHHAVVSEIANAAQFVLQIGGGVRSRDSIARWLYAGASRCVVGSLAVTEPRTVEDWFREFGADRIVLALDVRTSDEGIPILATHGWTRSSGVTLWECIDGYVRCGLKHVLCTDIQLDGALRGPNGPLYREFLRRYPEIELQASGGVRHRGDLEELRALGCAAAITGRALLDGRIAAEDISSFLQNG
jgi:phosphoribosylformimino-5-aminoimidazole carboxamide ribotide isomerase